MSYISPFGEIGSDHNGPDALCLSRAHCTDAVEETLAEFHQAAIAAIERPAPQPAFFLARQLAELGLKALHGSIYPRTHSLIKLLDSLGQRGDELLGDEEEQQLLVAFIRDLDAHDAGGDQGRYPHGGDLMRERLTDVELLKIGAQPEAQPAQRQFSMPSYSDQAISRA